MSAFDNRRAYRLRRRRYATGFAEAAAPGGAAPAAVDLGPDPRLEALEAESQSLRAEVESLNAQLAEAQSRHLRAHADLDNQRRRHQKEKEDLRRFATESLMEALAPAMDHFDLALQSFETATDVASLRQGVEMIHRELLGVLQANGLEPIQAKGASFDPNLHEAVATDADESSEDGVVLAVLRPGWQLRGRVLRPAMVKVNQLRSSSSATAAEA